ncbi:MAG: glycosyltransferase [Eubacteriales bacterium]|nr:glycosyltransferase [Eubacteriales bacterium]
MKVLMQSRKNFFELKGGDTIQLLKTKSELEKLGVQVDISLEYDTDLSSYDVVHLSNVTRIQETYMHVINAKKYGTPIVLSTIYWPMDEFEKNGQIGIRRIINKYVNIDNEERIKAFARMIKDKCFNDKAMQKLLLLGYSKMQKYVVDNVDFFLPNSEMEMEMLSKNFGIEKEKYMVIPNAIDKNIATMGNDSNELDEFDKYKDAIICVGRIEPRKNQLSLVRALDGLGYKLLLVGEVSDNQKDYFNEIKKIIDKNEYFYYIPRIENEKLYKLFSICRVSVLPSWLDTPGLVSLEAAVMGCNLAISSKGSTKEYFEDYAEYCLPDDLESIKRSVINAYNKEQNDNLKNRILEKYTWEIAAQKTLEAYKIVTNNVSGRRK